MAQKSGAGGLILDLVAHLMNRADAWAEGEPFLALLMMAASAAVFWAALVRRRARDPSQGFWAWTRPILESAAVALVLFAILWGVRLQLARVKKTFTTEHGAVSETNRRSVESIWGRPHVQDELQVQHTVTETVEQEVPSPYPGLGPRIVKRKVRRYLEQNSIQGTEGMVKIVLSYRRKGTAYYTGFQDECRFKYEVQNLANRATEAEFIFPMSPGQTMFHRLKVLVDGEDLSKQLTFGGSNLQWTMNMGAQQKVKVEVAYRSRGLDSYYYQIPRPREVRNFRLTMELPEVPERRLNYPERCMPPTAIKAINGGRGSLLTWALDRAMTTQGMGVALPPAPQPGGQVSRVLKDAWRGGMLLLVGLSFTFVAMGAGTQLVRLALLAAIYCSEFMLLSRFSDLTSSFTLSFISAAAVALVLSFLVLRWPRRISEARSLGLTAPFTVLYPLLTLPREAAPVCLTAAEVALVIYLVSLYLRPRRTA